MPGMPGMPIMNDPPEPRLVTTLRQASRILVFTGAGISTDSGIADYRGPQGVWKRRQPVYYQDFLTSEEARIEYWELKLESWESYRDAAPNRVHESIHRLERAGKLEMVVTQNIDGLHSRAGTSRELLVEIHGTDDEVECQSCHERSAPEPHLEYFQKHRRSPKCPCGGLLKQATISFGQNLVAQDLDRAMAAAERADLAVALGSTLSVTPAATIPLLAAQKGAPYVVINRGGTDHDRLPVVSLRLDGSVGAIFPPAVDAALD